MASQASTEHFAARIDRCWARMGMPRTIRHQRLELLNQAISVDPAITTGDVDALAQHWAGENRQLRIKAAWLEFAAIICLGATLSTFITSLFGGGHYVSLAGLAATVSAAATRFVPQLRSATRGPSSGAERSWTVVTAAAAAGLSTGAASYLTASTDVSIRWTVTLFVVGVILSYGVHRTRAAWR